MYMFTLREIAQKLQLPFQGSDLKIEKILDYARIDPKKGLKENAIYYYDSKASPKLTIKPKKSALLTSSLHKEHFPNAILCDESIKIKFIELLSLFDQGYPPPAPANTLIDLSAQIAPDAMLYPGCVVMQGAKVGPGARIFSNAVIEPGAEVGKEGQVRAGAILGYRCKIGEGSILYENAVIGGYGFGYHDENGTRYKIPQIGNVVLGDFVEVGSSSTIDRGAIESTIVGDFTKIDSQVHLAHNCRVGQYVYIAGRCGIAGSVEIGDGAILAGAVGVADHIKIAPKTILLANTGVDIDTEEGAVYFGSPAQKARTMHRINAALIQLPELVKRVKALEKEVLSK